MSASPKKRGRPSSSGSKTKPRSPSPIVVQDSEAEVQEEFNEVDGGSDTEEAEYEIEAIRSHRPAGKGGKKGTIEYLIKWKGWPEEDNSWEPEANTKNSQDLIDAYWKKIPLKSQKRKYDTVLGSKKRRASAAHSDSDENTNTPAGSSNQGGFSSEDDPSPRKSSKRAKSGSPSKSLKDDDGEEDITARFEELCSSYLDKYKKHTTWEPIVASVATMERGDDGVLKAKLEFQHDKVWSKAARKLGKIEEAESGPMIWVSNRLAREKCPQKLLDFYEAHLRFSRPPTPNKAE